MGCPICQASKNKVLQQYSDIGKYDDRSDLVQCQGCGHHYLVIKEKGAQVAYFDEGKYQLLDTRNSIFDRIKDWDAKRVIRSLNKKYEKGSALLDFGCGKGLFLASLKAFSWKGKGIETAASRANFGIEKYEVDIEIMEYADGQVNGGPFEVICLFHVLEHLDEPEKLLKPLIDHNLKENGTLVLEVPLFKSWQSLIGGRNWIQLDPPLHISHFDSTSLNALLQRMGMRDYKRQTFSLQLGVLGMVQSLMSRFGYRGDYIHDLKFKRTKKLLMATALILPFAFLLEFLGVAFGKGGVIRVYAKRAL